MLKLSGEALSGEGSAGIDWKTMGAFVSDIARVRDNDVEVAIVVGGGNFFRGRESGELQEKVGLGRTTADHIGMLATVMNGLALRDALRGSEVPAEVCAARGIEGVVPTFTVDYGERVLGGKSVLICAGGTGNPYFSTDTAACLRGVELNVDLIAKGTQVDGVYDSDPQTNPSAKRFASLTFAEAISLNLQFMDTAAMALCRDNAIPVVVYRISDPEALVKIVQGHEVGTIVK